MPETVLILGAKGRFGRAAVTAFKQAGWRVKAFARNVETAKFSPEIAPDDIVQGDAFRPGDVVRASDGCNVIVNALNPPYPRWSRDLPRITRAVIAAARASGATIMLPGNLYNYGAGMPDKLDEFTLHAPTTRKGLLREQMEECYAIAGDDNVRTIILRAGDFIERAQTGNWFDTYITPRISSEQITYPGDMNTMHAWAYLPDMARAMVGLAEKRAECAVFDTFGFGGYSLTGRELHEALEQIAGYDLKVNSMPWGFLKLVSPFSPMLREVLEMRYLWDTPHTIDDTRLKAFLPEFNPTPLQDALKDALADKLNQPKRRLHCPHAKANA